VAKKKKVALQSQNPGAAKKTGPHRESREGVVKGQAEAPCQESQRGDVTKKGAKKTQTLKRSHAIIAVTIRSEKYWA